MRSAALIASTILAVAHTSWATFIPEGHAYPPKDDHHSSGSTRPTDKVVYPTTKAVPHPYGGPHRPQHTTRTRTRHPHIHPPPPGAVYPEPTHTLPFYPGGPVHSAKPPHYPVGESTSSIPYVVIETPSGAWTPSYSEPTIPTPGYPVETTSTSAIVCPTITVTVNDKTCSAQSTQTTETTLKTETTKAPETTTAPNNHYRRATECYAVSTITNPESCPRELKTVTVTGKECSETTESCSTHYVVPSTLQTQTKTTDTPEYPTETPVKTQEYPLPSEHNSKYPIAIAPAPSSTEYVTIMPVPANTAYPDAE
ncbi:hypothetical protein BGZ63DRAFT_464506 [Mariannaea sp. PMI_226]|nr:hypothetical protein BGZ63DRAFT_464506 [Mariannaea sp. PMI_226]